MEDNHDLADAIAQAVKRGDAYEELYSFSTGTLYNFPQHNLSVSVPHAGEGAPYVSHEGATYGLGFEEVEHIRKAMSAREKALPKMSKSDLIQKLQNAPR